MNVDDLNSLLSSSQPPVLLHVLPPEVFETRRIPGSLNACIYEISFTDKVRSLVPDLSTNLVVYGAGEGGLEAKEAGERLSAAGYRNVQIFPGGLKAWRSAGFQLDGSGDSTAAITDGIYSLDAEASQIRWTGRNLFNHHHGTLRFANGRIEMKDSKLTAANFEIDMRSIVCDDIADESMCNVLVRHLMHADFFDVDNHPSARFESTLANPIPSASDGTPNYEITGNISLRGIQRSVRIPVVLASSNDGSKLAAQAQMEIDRTEFGSLYGSGKFFHYLGQHVVNDHFHIHLKIHASREG